MGRSLPLLEYEVADCQGAVGLQGFSVECDGDALVYLDNSVLGTNLFIQIPFDTHSEENITFTTNVTLSEAVVVADDVKITVRDGLTVLSNLTL